MKKTAWSHLPIAVHSDRVLASVKAHPDVWSAARVTLNDAAWYAAYDASGNAACNSAWDAAWGAARNAAYDAVGGAIAALVAWDDCAPYLSMTGDQLEMWYHLTERPACILLLPAVRAFEHIEEMEMA